MKSSLTCAGAIAALGLAGLFGTAIPAGAQGGGVGPLPPDTELKKMAALPTPRTADKHPDLTGYWGPPPPPPGAPASADNYGTTELSPDGKTITLGIIDSEQLAKR